MTANAIERILRPLLLVITAVMVVSVAFQVIARYVFAAPPVWTGESSTLALVYLTFLGAALVVERGEGFRITFLRDRYAHTPAGRRLWAGIRWFEAGFALLLVVLSVPMVTGLWLQNAVALGISIGWFALAIPLGLAGMAVALVRSVRREG
jgi:TRAP-type C4-dicarboxylate transport system permease small subunit